MRRIKQITSQLLSRLIAVNSLVVFMVILVAGISVKDYACYLVNYENVSGPDLVETLNAFLIKVSILAFLVAGLFHYFSVKRIVKPIKTMSMAAKEIKEGKIPPEIKIQTSGELGELGKNFNAMADTLSSIQLRREEMLKDIAHELRTPLTNINGYLEALHGGIINGNRELFGSLLEESRRITRIVELLTELNSWGKEIYFLEKPFDYTSIDEILNESITAFQLKLNEQFEKVNIRIEAAFIIGHKDGLKQVFSNLIQNIIDYDLGKKLSISGFSDAGQYRITFTHTGLFIDFAKKELIFERFYRLEESRSTKAEGAGLGLAIARSIIEAHKGEIGLSTDGNNHIFWINIPTPNNSYVSSLSKGEKQ
ncbi:sensor histidine kinase [Bacillus canaveralius]|nr:HAMP domain-containing sensor histidine kinase [Bacillus canaveralius]